MDKNHEFWRKRVVTGIHILGGQPIYVTMEEVYYQFALRYTEELKQIHEKQIPR